MSPRTLFLSRLLGLYCSVAGLCLLVRGPAIANTVMLLLHDPQLVFFIGAVLLAAGLAMVISHNIWSGGALPVVVTLIGWATAIKGGALLAFAPQAVAEFYLNELRYQKNVYVFAAISLLVGLYLVYGGFKKR
jgi:hypothetical protein